MSTAKQGAIEVQAIISDWLNDYGFTGKVEEDNLKRWASDRGHEITGPEQLTYSLALLDIRNHTAELPLGLHSIYVVACTTDCTKSWNEEMLVGYTKKLYGTDCDIEVNLICPDCKNSKCTCKNNHGVMDIQVDDLYLQARPWIAAQLSSKFVGHVAAETDGPITHGGHPKFHFMKPQSSDSALWNTDHYLGMCQNLGNVECYTYKIEPPEFITDLKEGQVFLAYRRYNFDAEGYYMIPNYKIAIRAVTAYITEKAMQREWMINGNQTDRLRWLDAKNESERLLVQAQSELETPSPDEWMALARKHWLQGSERFHYGRPR